MKFRNPKFAFRLGIAALFVLALGLRGWRLGQFNTLVFDEAYYVQFAADYLHQEPFRDAHPPLGKYLIALGIVLGQPLADALNGAGNYQTGFWLSPISYRWVTATVGAGIPPLVALVAERISLPASLQRRRVFALLAGGLALMEGLSLVESRFGLINMYWVFWGLLGQWCLLKAASAPPKHPMGQQRSGMGGWSMGAGLAFGAAVNVKWNGAGFLLSVWLLWLLGRFFRRRSRYHEEVPCLLPLSGQMMAFSCALLPLVVYCLLWVPHLWLTGDSLLGIHRQLWQFHQTLSGSHHYCSPWWSWPLMLRPVAYFYGGGELPALSQGAAGRVYTVQGLGNPLLWWLSTAAVLSLLGQWISKLCQSPNGRLPSRMHPVGLFLLVNFGANWLPWLLVQRCTFLYHYLGALMFSLLALAWLMSRWLMPSPRPIALWLLGGIGLSFWFWLPLFLGLPLSPEALRWRWWLPSWI